MYQYSAPLWELDQKENVFGEPLLLEPTPLPRREQLPDWAVVMLDDSSRNLPELARKSVARNMPCNEFFEVVPSGRAYLTVCTVSVEIDGTIHRVKAQSWTKTEAQRIAWFHVLAKLHAQGVDEPISAQDLDKGRPTLVNVYRYCARLGALPMIQLRRNDQKRLFEYTIRLAEQGIQVCGSASQVKAACISATSAFKRAAHPHARRNGASKWLAAAPSRIESEHAEEFLKWLSITHSLTWTIENVPLQKGDEGTGESGIVCRCEMPTSGGEPQLLSSPALFGGTTKDDREQAAIIHAAVSISRSRPEWLAGFEEAMRQNEKKPGLSADNQVSKASQDSTELKAPKKTDLEAPKNAPKNADLKIPKKVASSQDAIHLDVSERTEPPKGVRKTNLDISLASHTLMQVVPDLTGVEEKESTEPDDLRHRRRRWSHLTQQAKEHHSQFLAHAYSTYDLDAPRVIRQARKELPVASYRHKLMQLVDNNVYSIFIGATGSGKTTQVPQLIFEDWCRRGHGADCNIICTQPRVIAATSVASRVADEVGPRLRDRVGFHVRKRARIPHPRDGSITFCTTGILLQQLQNEPDFILDNVSHLIIDEVHERDMVLDFTLAVLKRAVTGRLERGLKVPKILLMSATLDKEVFSNHFKNVGADGELIPAPSLSVPGRTFPVQEKYLAEVLWEMDNAHGFHRLRPFRDDPKYYQSMKYIQQELNLASTNPTTIQAGAQQTAQKDAQKASARDLDTPDELATPTALIAETIAHVLRTTHTGAVLVFLPGLGEINKIEALLRDWRILGIDINFDNKYRLFKLHSSLPDSQETVFQTVPAGVRKIILSSPVAETSVTIPDVTCVIDSGQVRELQYDNVARASWLRNGWINGSSAKQRAGRAGRVQKGTYFAMYSKGRRETMPAAGVPELMRADLQSTCLAVKSIVKNVEVPEFLAAAIDPPKDASVENAMRSLVNMGALTPQRELTSLGRLLSDFPIHPSLAKMVLMGIVFKCLDPIIIAGAAIEEQDLWVSTPDLRGQVSRSKIDFARGSGSDLIATYNAFCLLRNRRLSTTEDRLLHMGAFRRIKESASTIREKLVELGLLPANDAGLGGEWIGGDALNTNSRNHHVVRAVLVAGLHANIGSRKDKKFRLGDRPDAHPGSSSIFETRDSRANLELVAFGELAVAQESYVMRHVSAISPITAALFGATLTTSLSGARPIVVVNKFMPLPVAVWTDEPADEPSNKDAWRVLWQFRKTLDQVLGIAFANLARARRGMAGASSASDGGSAAVVSEFVDRVVRVLDTEARVDEKQREAAIARRAEYEQLRKKQRKEEEQERQRQRKQQKYEAQQRRSKGQAERQRRESELRRQKQKDQEQQIMQQYLRRKQQEREQKQQQQQQQPRQRQRQQQVLKFDNSLKRVRLAESGAGHRKAPVNASRHSPGPVEAMFGNLGKGTQGKSQPKPQPKPKPKSQANNSRASVSPKATGPRAVKSHAPQVQRLGTVPKLDIEQALRRLEG